MERLNDFERDVLENLPVEPVGLSLAELADGLLDDRSPAAKGKVRRALSAYQLVAGTIDTTALAAGDVLEVDITATAGGGTLGKGVFCYADLHEKES